MCTPIPVASESIDFTPPELWPVIWEHYPGGTEVPSAIPKHAWEKNWREWHPEEAKLGKSAPEAPALLKCYWGKLRDRALTSRKTFKRAKVSHVEETEPLPPVFPPRLSDAFWQDYFRIFPEGHGAPGYSSAGYSGAGYSGAGNSSGGYASAGYSSANFKSAGEPGKPYEDPTLYKLIRGSLHVMANGVWRPSTGVDAWDKSGKWMGPG